MNVILLALGVLGVLGAVGSLVLYFVSKKFYVYEDPRVGQVEEVLPGANCGGCGFPGCHGMADACVKEKDASNSLGSLQKSLESSELRQVPLNLNLLWFDAMATWNVVLNLQPMMA